MSQFYEEIAPGFTALVSIETIPVDDVIANELKGFDKKKAEIFALAMKAGSRFPMIAVFGRRFEDDKYKVYDGKLRLNAYKIIGKKNVKAKVIRVTEEGMPFFSNAVSSHLASQFLLEIN